MAVHKKLRLKVNFRLKVKIGKKYTKQALIRRKQKWLYYYQIKETSKQRKL